MPYFQLDGLNLYDRLQAPRFYLLIFSDGGTAYDALAKTVETEFGERMDVCTLPLYPLVGEKLGTHRSVALLLRPDNHIGYITTHVSVDELRAYIHNLNTGFGKPD